VAQGFAWFTEACLGQAGWVRLSSASHGTVWPGRLGRAPPVGQGSVFNGTARHGPAGRCGLGVAWSRGLGSGRFGKASQCPVWRGSLGSLWSGRLGPAWCGSALAVQGAVTHGPAGYGRQGGAGHDRRGTARPELGRQGPAGWVVGSPSSAMAGQGTAGAVGDGGSRCGKARYVSAGSGRLG
jgi:hypothetical protein